MFKIPLHHLALDVMSVLFPIVPISNDTMLFVCGMSRSGTTLLTTVIDSHSQICMGYELIPPPLPKPETIVNILEEGMILSSGDFSRCGALIRKAGNKDVGLWLARCHRAGATAEDVRRVLATAMSLGIGRICTFVERLKLAHLVTKCIQEKTNNAVYGFKYTSTYFALGRKAFPNGYFIYILRDPRDIVASQKKRGFKRTTKEICQDWKRCTDAFMKFHAKYQSTSQIIRYEDLVSRPLEVISQMFEKLPVNLEPGVFKFHESKATVHTSRHPNSKNLKKDFFTDSICSWKNQLDISEVAKIEKLCHKNLEVFKYETSN